MKSPKLVTLLPEEKEKDEKSEDFRLATKLVVNIAAVVILRSASFFALRKLKKTIKQFN